MARCAAVIGKNLDRYASADRGASEFFEALPASALEIISKAGRGRVGDGNVALFARPDVRTLILSGPQLTDAGLEELSPRKRFSEKKKALLPDSWEDQTDGDQALSGGCSRLETLEIDAPLSGTPLFEDVGLPALRRLKLGAHLSPSSTLLEALVLDRALPALTHLDLADASPWCTGDLLRTLVAKARTTRSDAVFHHDDDDLDDDDTISGPFEDDHILLTRPPSRREVPLLRLVLPPDTDPEITAALSYDHRLFVE